MRAMFCLSVVALRQVVGPGSDSALSALANRYSDQSCRLLNTLKAANTQAWKAVEIALAGSSWWDRAKRAVATTGDQRAFRNQVQSFLDAAPIDGIPGDGPAFRKKCLEELKAARKAGLLPGEDVTDPDALQKQAKALARFSDPRAVLDEEFASVARVAEDLVDQGYPNIAKVVALRPPGGRPLIVIAVEYFFRRDVTADPVLSAEFQFHELGRLASKQEEGFEGLHLALAQQGDQLETLLDSALELLEETHAAVKETRDDVKALRDEMAQERQSLALVYQAVMKLLEQTQAAQAAPAPAVIAAPSAALPAAPEPAEPAEDTIAEIRELVDQCGAMPTTEKREHKALFRAIGKLKATVRTYDAKRRLRKNVLPSALFTAGKATAPKPTPLAPEYPAEPVEESKAEAPPAAAANTVNSIFGKMPKPKIRRPNSDKPE